MTIFDHYYPPSGLDDLIRETLDANPDCRISSIGSRLAISRDRSGRLEELAVLVGSVSEGHVYGHVFFDHSIERWRTLLVFSTRQVMVGDEATNLANYRRIVVDGHDFEPVIFFERIATSAVSPDRPSAIRALVRILTNYTVAVAGTCTMGGHVDPAPIVAYGFLKETIMPQPAPEGPSAP